jgi:hypothetical protein
MGGERESERVRVSESNTSELARGKHTCTLLLVCDLSVLLRVHTSEASALSETIRAASTQR